MGNKSSTRRSSAASNSSNTSSSTASSSGGGAVAAPPAFKRSAHLPSLLDEADAWEIAMTWREALRGHVRLVTGPSPAPSRAHTRHLKSLVNSYEWVRIDLPVVAATDTTALSATRARAFSYTAWCAILSWLALSHCEGFAGHENAIFWRRVFCELQGDSPSVSPLDGPGGASSPWTDALDGSASVSDAVPFFPCAARAFPRVLLHVHGDMDMESISTTCCRIVCGLEEPEMDHASEHGRQTRQLERVLQRLVPFMHDTSRDADTTVTVALSVEARQIADGSSEDDNGISHLLHAINHERTSSSTWLRAGSFRGINSTLTAPRFIVRDLVLRGVPQLLTERDTVMLARFFATHHELHVPELATGSFTHVPASSLATFLLATVRHVDRWSGHRPYLTDAQWEAMCATLPVSPHCQAVRLGGFRTSSDSRLHHDLAWLMFAVFHPNARDSRWRVLEVQDLELTEQALEIVHCMAKGNNLLELAQGLPTKTTAYHCTQLAAGTTIRAEAREAALALATLSVATMVDLCVTSLDRITWGSWIAVIVPGYGPGWVRTRAVGAVTVRAPSVSQLRVLQLSPREPRKVVPHDSVLAATEAHQKIERLLEFLALLGGHELEYLDIRAWGDLDGATLHRVLRLCPKLTTLRVTHNGEFWKHTAQTREWLAHRGAKLRELELCLPEDAVQLPTPSTAALYTALRGLQVVRVAVHPACASYRRSRDALTELLRECASLRYLHWQTIHWSAPHLPYAQVHRESERALAQLRRVRSRHLIAPGPLRRRERMAFLSVLHRQQRPRYEPHVIEMIFAFASSEDPRCICLEPQLIH